jgi:hypothetical protein
MVTATPRLINWVTVAKPRPEAPPVTMAELLLRSMSSSLLEWM